MPPDDAEQPTDEERELIAQWILDDALKVDCVGPERPGRVTIRRLNRHEYDNTIRDLFGVDLQLAQTFPSDDVGYGFDNIGDVLSVSPVLFERYVDAADEIVRTIIASTDVEAAPRRQFEGSVSPRVVRLHETLRWKMPASMSCGCGRGGIRQEIKPASCLLD